MTGSLLQLSAYGKQDTHLTGNPQITFFKVVYRRHTNFSIESIEQTISGDPTFGNTVECSISRSGDLISNIWLQMKPNIEFIISIIFFFYNFIISNKLHLFRIKFNISLVN